MGEKNNEDDDPEISKHVHITVKKDTKRAWLEYAEEHYHGVLSSLVKDAVNQYIDEKWVLANEEDNTETEVDIEGVSEIKSDLTAIREQIDSLSMNTPIEDDSLSESETITLANRVLDNLPSVPDRDSLLELNAHLTVEDREVPKVTGAADDLAIYLDEEEEHVRRACLYLEHNEIETVESVIDDGVRRWYQINPRVDRWDENEYLQSIDDIDAEFQTGNEWSK